MSKFSMPKTVLMLVIISFYVFLFGIMGFTGIKDTDANDNTSETTSTAATTLNTTTTAEITVPITTLQFENYFKPDFADYTVVTTPKHDDIVIDNEALTVIITTTPDNSGEITLPPDETTATTAATTARTTTTPKTTTTTAPKTTTAPTVLTTTKKTTSTAAATTATTTEFESFEIEESESEESESETSQSNSEENINTESPPITGDETLTILVNGSVISGTAHEIISMMVNCEMGSSFAEEALKAQAVAAYTYVKYYNSRGGAPSVLIKEYPSSIIKDAVAKVIGQAIYYKGSYIQAVYCASSAGYTASSKNVWGSDLPYLQSISCDVDALYDPNYGIKSTFTSAEIKNAVKTATGIELTGDPSEWIKILPKKEGGKVDNVYVGLMSVGGYTSYNGGDTNITGRVFREKIMNFKIKSASFKVDYDAESDNFIFTTYGYGHGVGMSQNGANLYAKHYNYDYKQILEHYYRNCTIS